MDALLERVKGHLGEVNPHHISLVETVKLLCDELDEVKSGKPDWMR
jgi:hypothetical protein